MHVTGGFPLPMHPRLQAENAHTSQQKAPGRAAAVGIQQPGKVAAVVFSLRQLHQDVLSWQSFRAKNA
jgi:uncharacterized DUF497 family protein